MYSTVPLHGEYDVRRDALHEWDDRSPRELPAKLAGHIRVSGLHPETSHGITSL